jgi:hypothetical protein
MMILLIILKLRIHTVCMCGIITTKYPLVINVCQFQNKMKILKKKVAVEQTIHCWMGKHGDPGMFLSGPGS